MRTTTLCWTRGWQSTVNKVHGRDFAYYSNNEPTLSGYLAGNFSQTYDLSLPSVQTFLPNTLTSPNSFTPAFKISRNRAHVSVVIGKESSHLIFPGKKSRDSADLFSLFFEQVNTFFRCELNEWLQRGHCNAIFTICRYPHSEATVPELPGDHTPERPR